METMQISAFKTLHPSSFHPFAFIHSPVRSMDHEDSESHSLSANILSGNEQQHIGNITMTSHSAHPLTRSPHHKQSTYVSHIFLMTENAIYRLNLSLSAQMYLKSHKLLCAPIIECGQRRDKEGIFPASLNQIGASILDDFTWDHTTQEIQKRLKMLKAVPYGNQDSEFRIVFTIDYNIYVADPHGQLWNITEKIQSCIKNNIHLFQASTSEATKILDELTLQKFKEVSNETDEPNIFNQLLVNVYHEYFKQVRPEVYSSVQNEIDESRFNESFQKAWNNCDLDTATTHNREALQLETRLNMDSLVRKRKRPNLVMYKRKRNVLSNTIGKHYFSWSHTRITTFDIIEDTSTKFTLAVGFHFGSIAIFSSPFASPLSEILQIATFVPQPIHNDLYGMRIAKLKWISNSQLIAATSNGEVSLFSYNSETAQLKNQGIIHKSSDLCVTDLFFYKYQENHYIAIVFSISCVVCSFSDFTLHDLKLIRSQNQYSSIQSVCILKNTLDEDEMAYMSTRSEVIAWNLTENTQTKIQLPAAYRSDETQVCGISLSSNNLVLHTLLKKDDMAHLVHIPIIPVESLREYLLTLDNISGTTDVALYCELLQKEESMLSFFEIFRDFEKKPLLKSVAYRAAPYISEDWKKEIYVYLMYDFALRRIECLTRKNLTTLLFCDWIFTYYQKLNIRSPMMKESVLEQLVNIYRENNDEECMKHVEVLLNLKRKKSEDREGISAFQQFILPHRSVSCLVCSEPLQKNGNLDLQIESSCGHSNILDIQTLLPTDGIHCTICDNCGVHSSVKMTICFLCGNEYCSSLG